MAFSTSPWQTLPQLNFPTKNGVRQIYSSAPKSEGRDCIAGTGTAKICFFSTNFSPASQQTSVIYKHVMGKPVTGCALFCAILNLWISVSSGVARTPLTFTFVENVHILFFQGSFVPSPAW